MDLLTNEQIAEVKNAMSKIGSMAHYARNWSRGYNVSRGFTEDQQNACNILNKYNIYRQTNSYADKISNIMLVEKYLNKCSAMNDILDAVYKHNWNYSQTNEYFNDVLQHFKDIFEKKQRDLECKQRQLQAIPLKDLS